MAANTHTQVEAYRTEAEQAVESVEGFRKKHARFYRAMEIFPGAVVWMTMIGMSVLAYFFPIPIAVIMIVYVLSWLARSIRFSYFLLRSYPAFLRSIKVHWQEKINADPALTKRAKAVRHVILAATYKEEYETLARALTMLSQSTFPHDQIIFVLATEGRDHEHAQKVAAQLKKKFGPHFYDFIITEHPADILGEIKGKGSNISWAGRVVRDYCAQKGFNPADVLVTSIDADHRLHPEYLSALTYSYLTDPNPLKSAYVSVALFFNNVWDVPSSVRFIHFSSTFWMMATSVWTSRLHNVMTQTQTLEALIKTDFYSPTSIVEDGHQYWRSLFVFGKDYNVRMVLMPVYSDAVLHQTFFGTLREQYLQRRRWHYGISDFPYVATHLWCEKKERSARAFIDFLRHWEGHFSLATSSVMLGVVGWIPLQRPELIHTVLGAHFRALYVGSLRYALLGILVSAIISISLVPPRYPDKPWSRLYLLWDYLLLPIQIVASIVLAASLPSIEAHTRLMLGKYLGSFHVTYKAVSTKTSLDSV